MKQLLLRNLTLGSVSQETRGNIKTHWHQMYEILLHGIPRI